jgi:Trk K+ transport system NAD-binding subunit
VAGNASEPAVLIQAHITHATMLVIATPDTFHVRAMIETARALNPTIMTVVRTHSEKRRNCCARKRGQGVHRRARTGEWHGRARAAEF